MNKRDDILDYPIDIINDPKNMLINIFYDLFPLFLSRSRVRQRYIRNKPITDLSYLKPLFPCSSTKERKLMNASV